MYVFERITNFSVRQYFSADMLPKFPINIYNDLAAVLQISLKFYEMFQSDNELVAQKCFLLQNLQFDF